MIKSTGSLAHATCHFISRSLTLGFAALCGLASLSLSHPATAQGTYRHLPGHVPALVSQANLAGSVRPAENIPLAITLPLRNEGKLDALVQRLYDPKDPLYGQYLTPERFAADYAPTPADYEAVVAYAKSQGLTVTQRHANRLVLDVVAPARTVENAFGVRLKQYKLDSGRIFRAPNGAPSVPTAVAGRIKSIIGLDTAEQWHAHNRMKAVDPLAFMNPVPDSYDPLGLHSNQVGTGPGGALTPNDIKKAYNLSSVTQDGTGQTLGLFELDGYTASDVTAYEKYFWPSTSLPKVTLQNVLVDSATGSAGNGAGEVTLDIELMIALAPNASKILVYEGPNSSTGLIDTYNKIATDNLAKSISTSWGIYESGSSATTLDAEYTIFKEMAVQGQSMFAASGDSGAYDNGSSLSVDDPASQPWVTGVGGTTLTLQNGLWKSEKTWNGGSIANGGGGGGISSVWAIPDYQSQAGVITTASKGSTTMRNVPDVSLDADPNTGYSIYFQGGWYIFGGTSCAAPLWATFTGLVNEARASAGLGTLGFANYPIYMAGLSTSYTSYFHDINDGSTNLYYPAVTGYDLATGWGSFNGANLLTAATSVAVTYPTQLLGNTGFESGTAYFPWVASSSKLIGQATTAEPAHAGTWRALLGGTTTKHTDYLYQKVAIPAKFTKATLSYYEHIDTQELATTGAVDTLNVYILNSGGSIVSTLTTLSNKNAGTGYTQVSFDLSSYIGQTIYVYFQFTQGGTKATTTTLDDVTLTVQ